MLKTIPKSSVNRRAFQVYKLWNISGAALISGSDTPLYRSIRAKYYNQTDGNIFTTFGSSENLAEISNERELADTIWVIDIDRNKFGEQIKKNTIRLTDSAGNEFIDNGDGKIINPIPTYNFISFDAELGLLTIEQDFVEYEIDVISFNLETGGIVLLDDGNAETYFVVSIDFQTGIITFTYELDFEGLGLEALKYGNVFYSDGVIVINGEVGLASYELEYRSTQTIYETEVLISVKAGEFNYSQNPSAVEVKLNDSYNFETTGVLNSIPGGNTKIKEVLDIKRREYFSGSIDESISGSWDDYFNYLSIDPTGSYLTTYITTIGLYDESGDMVAVAKLPKPIKNLPDYDVNFIVRFDT
jgi:hypothetical protein